MQEFKKGRKYRFKKELFESTTAGQLYFEIFGQPDWVTRFDGLEFIADENDSMVYVYPEGELLPYQFNIDWCEPVKLVKNGNVIQFPGGVK